MSSFSSAFSSAFGSALVIDPGIDAPGEIALIADHCADGLSVLLTEYQDSPIIQAWICSFLARVQVAENDAVAMLRSLDIETAVGTQLNLLGDIVRETRNGLSDVDYRRAIRVRILVNRSNGTISQLARIVALWTGYAAHLREYPPASAEIRVLGPPGDAVGLARRVRQAKAAGVRIVTTYQTMDPAFTLSANHGSPQSSATLGLGSSHVTTGGHLAGAIG